MSILLEAAEVTDAAESKDDSIPLHENRCSSQVNTQDVKERLSEKKREGECNKKTQIST